MTEPLRGIDKRVHDALARPMTLGEIVAMVDQGEPTLGRALVSRTLRWLVNSGFAERIVTKPLTYRRVEQR